ncbi:carbohydrate ABC transporter substrate-binding protein [Paenibacillus sp. MWE-103]|uniref:Carbohydrate ABC transporter substrate-binding protein n=1 Tax=Paenibacillus artemisiicola TaxID=1172618 RepID=A0ABS3W3X9_9BACL|nr:ABC transporter substrate-binding protein [Paenibacillus artemisiicola]MBO7743019.1 carbohydrate ABC transporter substrate-binding protein [Paenibacillus artemisiicola]
MNKWLILCAAGLLAMAATGCASGDEGAEPAAASEQGTAKGKTVLKLAIQKQSDYYAALEKGFEAKYPAIDVQIKAYGQEYQKTANAELLAGKGADLYETDSLPVQDYLDKKTFVNLDDRLAQEKELDRNDLETNILQAVKLDGGTYAVPAGFSLRAFIGDGDALQTESYDERKWTWTDFAAFARQAIEREQASGKERRYAMTDYTPDMLLQEMFIDNYPAFVDRAARKASFDGPEFTAMMKQIKQMYDDRVMSADPAASGKQLFYSAVLQSPADFINGPYALFANPVLVQKPHAAGQPGGMRIIPQRQLAVNAKSTVQDKAWAFIAYALSKEGQSLPARPGMSLLKSVNAAQLDELRQQAKAGTYKLPGGKPVNVPDERFAQYAQLLDTATNYALPDSRLMNIVGEEAITYFGGQKSAEEAAKLIQNRVTTYLNE